MNLYEKSPKSKDLGGNVFSSLSGHSYDPRLHERVIDHVQKNSNLYKGLVATAIAAGFVALSVYALNKPGYESMSLEDKSIMREQMRLEELMDNGVPLKHLKLDDGTIHTIPRFEYEPGN